ncbi:MAG: hypothetical protein ACJZ64_01890 [Opitutales bacterium]
MKKLFLLILSVSILTIASAQSGLPGTWNQNTAYASGSLVISNGSTYLAQKAVPSGTALTSTAYWQSLDSAVPTSTPGTAPTSTPDVTTAPTSTPASDSNTSTGNGGTSSPSDDPNLSNAGSTDVQLRGISTAGYVSASSRLSGGFTISGGSMTVLTSGKGGKEILSNGTFQDTLNDPTMEMKNLLTGASLYTNNDWSTGPHQSQLQSTGFFNAYESDDAGLYVTLDAGSYLTDISSSDGDSGGCFVEVYNTYGFFDFVLSSSKLTGISTNGIVNAGNEPGQRMTAALNIGNFGTDANATKRMIVMAKYSLGVTTDHLEDPRLEVRDVTGAVIAQNRDWSDNAASVQTAITSTGLMNGYRNKDAALILTVAPGSYFIDVYSQDGDSGGSLVEVYDLDLLESLYGWNLGN